MSLRRVDYVAGAHEVAEKSLGSHDEDDSKLGVLKSFQYSKLLQMQCGGCSQSYE